MINQPERLGRPWISPALSSLIDAKVSISVGQLPVAPHGPGVPTSETKAKLAAEFA